MTRPLWLLLGIAATASGIVGIVLPLVPTTPFILLAAFAFARSSPRLQVWIESHRTFGPMIDNWRRYGSISRRVKYLSVALMAATFALSLALQFPLWLLALHGAILLAVALFMLTRPDGPPPGSGRDRSTNF
jgi:uncharacterized membrane protein YbaN (DUF454 family)